MSRFDNNCLWITGGLDDRFTVPVFVSEICGHREVGDPCVTDIDDVHISDVSSDLDSVQLFHNSVYFWLLSRSYTHVCTEERVEKKIT